MTREERLEICRKCKHKVRDFKKGIICKLTDEQADFEDKCENFIEHITEEDNPKKWEEAQIRYMHKKEIICPICGNNEYKARRTLLTTKVAAYFETEVFGHTARNFICTKCKHILWFY